LSDLGHAFHVEISNGVERGWSRKRRIGPDVRAQQQKAITIGGRIWWINGPNQWDERDKLEMIECFNVYRPSATIRSS
jgi:hypothetical protein